MTARIDDDDVTSDAAAGRAGQERGKRANFFDGHHTMQRRVLDAIFH